MSAANLSRRAIVSLDGQSWEPTVPTIPPLQIDVFTDRPFAGNAAAVCLLDDADPGECNAAWMQAVAAEMNLSETAFVRRADEDFDLRWFTPTVEVDLCGHATLAAAHALWSRSGAPAATIRFLTRSGVLTASRAGELIELDFPATPPVKCDLRGGLMAALVPLPDSNAGGLAFVGETRFDLFLELCSAEDVRALRPDFRRLADIPTRGVIVTAASDDPRYDFVSRFLAPRLGIDEDPVTGSAHCALGPYWSEKLGKPRTIGYQASARGGVVHVQVRGDRVNLGGKAVTVFDGRLNV
jgi:PhzF family phenazine biosynthesis protein